MGKVVVVEVVDGRQAEAAEGRKEVARAALAVGGGVAHGRRVPRLRYAEVFPFELQAVVKGMPEHDAARRAEVVVEVVGRKDDVRRSGHSRGQQSQRGEVHPMSGNALERGPVGIQIPVRPRREEKEIAPVGAARLQRIALHAFVALWRPALGRDCQARLRRISALPTLGRPKLRTTKRRRRLRFEEQVVLRRRCCRQGQHDCQSRHRRSCPPKPVCHIERPLGN